MPTPTSPQKTYKSLRSLLLLALALQWTVSKAISQTAGEYFSNSPTHSTFAAALQQIGILNELTATNVAVTVFAPTDQQFQDLGFPWTEYLNHSPWLYHLLKLLTFHIIPGQVTTAEIFDGKRKNITTLASEFVMKIDQARQIIDDDTSIVTGDIVVSNGLVHVPDRVLVPPTMKTSLGDLLIAGQYQESELTLPYSTFNAMLQVSNMRSLLFQVNPDGLTAMVPVDDAFGDKDLVTAIFTPGNENVTKHLVMYHIVPANVFLQRFTTLDPPQLPVQMLNGVTAWFTTTDNFVQVNGVNFLHADDMRSNGIAHFINEFLVPPNVKELLSITTKVSSFSFEKFLHSIVARNIQLVHDKGFVTIFSPLDDAFAAEVDLVSRFEQEGWELHFDILLSNHIVATGLDSVRLVNRTKTTVKSTSGSNVTIIASNNDNITVDDASVVVSDLFAIDGVIHGINKILVGDLKDSIYQRLRKNPTHATLVKIIDLVGFASELDRTNASACTLLAPSNIALQQVDLTNRVALRNLLEAHLFHTNLYSHQFANMSNTLTAANGAEYMVTATDGSIFIGSARIVEVDGLASNGLIHTIDQLLNVSSTVSPFRPHSGAGTPWSGTPTTTSSYTQQEHVASGTSGHSGGIFAYTVYLALALMGVAFIAAVAFIFTRK